jgi:hypothetical protein
MMTGFSVLYECWVTYDTREETQSTICEKEKWKGNEEKREGWKIGKIAIFQKSIAYTAVVA